MRWSPPVGTRAHRRSLPPDEKTGGRRAGPLRNGSRADDATATGILPSDSRDATATESLSLPVPTLPTPYADVAVAAKGFLPVDEGEALYAAALTAAPGTWLEVGTYCGKSTVHLGAAARGVGAHLVTLDHHRGSEENQPGWEWHDASLIDPHTGRLETLPSLRHTLWDAALDDTVSVLVATTQQVARWWT